MRGLSLVGLLVGLGVVGTLMFKQLKPSPETGNSLPTEAIDKANEAADIMEQQQKGAAQSLEQQAEQPQPDTQNLP